MERGVILIVSILLHIGAAASFEIGRYEPHSWTHIGRCASKKLWFKLSSSFLGPMSPSGLLYALYKVEQRRRSDEKQHDR